MKDRDTEDAILAAAKHVESSWDMRVNYGAIR